MEKSSHSILRRIAFIGNSLPRRCGIATFTTDLCETVADEYKSTACIALPVNETEAGYEYPARVRFELAESTLAFLQSLLELRLAENVDQPNEQPHNEQSSLGSFSAPQTHPAPDNRQLAVSSQ